MVPVYVNQNIYMQRKMFRRPMPKAEHVVLHLLIYWLSLYYSIILFMNLKAANADINRDQPQKKVHFLCIGLTYALTKSQPLDNLSEVRHDFMSVSDSNQKQKRTDSAPSPLQVGVFTLVDLFGGGSDDLQQEEEDLDDVDVD